MFDQSSTYETLLRTPEHERKTRTSQYTHGLIYTYEVIYFNDEQLLGEKPLDNQTNNSFVIVELIILR